MNTLNRMAELRQYVRKHDLSQEKLAAKIGVSHSWLSKFAQGSMKNPRVNTLAKVERHYQRSRGRER